MNETVSVRGMSTAKEQDRQLLPPVCKKCDGEGTLPKFSGPIKCTRCNGKGWLTKKQEGMQV